MNENRRRGPGEEFRTVENNDPYLLYASAHNLVSQYGKLNLLQTRQNGWRLAPVLYPSHVTPIVVKELGNALVHMNLQELYERNLDGKVSYKGIALNMREIVSRREPRKLPVAPYYIFTSRGVTDEHGGPLTDDQLRNINTDMIIMGRNYYTQFGFAPFRTNVLHLP